METSTLANKVAIDTSQNVEQTSKLEKTNESTGLMEVHDNKQGRERMVLESLGIDEFESVMIGAFGNNSTDSLNEVHAMEITEKYLKGDLNLFNHSSNRLSVRGILFLVTTWRKEFYWITVAIR
jgi:hypothetical protein